MDNSQPSVCLERRIEKQIANTTLLLTVISFGAPVGQRDWMPERQGSLRHKTVWRGGHWVWTSKEISKIGSLPPSSVMSQARGLASKAWLVFNIYFLPPWPSVLVRGVCICFHHLLTLWHQANCSYRQNKHNDNTDFTGVSWDCCLKEYYKPKWICKYVTIFIFEKREQ